MIPIIQIVAAMVAMQGVSTAFDIFSTHQTTKASDQAARYTQDFYNGSFTENSRFWQDYIRKHHLEGREIKYPYRTGMNYNMSQLYGSESALTSNRYARYGSYVHGANNMVKSVGYPMMFRGNTYVPKKNYTDVMYG